MRPTVATLNFTSRKRIERNNVRISGVMNGSEGFFVLEKFDVDEHAFPPLANVVIESYTGKYGFQRFTIGVIDGIDLTRHHPFPLSDLPNAVFRIKVVSGDLSTAGRILGDADKIPIEIGGRPPSLLPIDPVDLDNRVWWLDFDDELGPVLQMNERLPDYQQIARDDGFRATVLPTVVYQIVMWLISKTSEGEGDSIVRRWVKALTFPGIDLRKIDFDDDETKKDFALKVAKAFAKQNGFIDKFNIALDKSQS